MICCIDANLGSENNATYAVVTLIQKVSQALDKGKTVVGVNLDVKKTFDTVDHVILLKKSHRFLRVLSISYYMSMISHVHPTYCLQFYL